MNTVSQSAPKTVRRRRPSAAASSTNASRVLPAVAQVFSCNLVAQVLTGVAGILLISFMRESEYARLTLALSIGMVASQILSGSFNRIYIVAHRQLNVGDFTSQFLGFQLLMAALAAIVFWPLTFLLGGLYALVIAMVVARCLSDYAQTVYQRELAFLQFGLVGLGQSVAVLAVVLVLVATVGNNVKTWEVLLTQTIALLGVFVLTAQRRVSWKVALQWSSGRRLALALLGGQYGYLFGYFAILAVFLQLDIWIVRLLENDLALATYGSAYRYYALLLLILGGVHVVLLPHIERVHAVEELDALFRKQRILLAAFVPLACLAAWLAQWIIPWIDHGRYPDAVAVFRVLAVVAVVSFAFSPYVNVLVARNDFRFLFLSILGTAPLHGAICAWLTSTHGVVGTAAAGGISSLVFNGMTFLRAQTIRRRMPTAAAEDLITHSEQFIPSTPETL